MDRITLFVLVVLFLIEFAMAHRGDGQAGGNGQGKSFLKQSR